MYIEFVTNVDGTPIPHVNGMLHHPLADFLIYLRVTYMKKGGRREAETIVNNYNHMKIWLDYCVDVGVRYDQATFDIHLVVFREYLLEKGLLPQSINVYYRTWRSFYEWCDFQGLPHLMQFPAKLQKKIKRSTGSFFQSNVHTIESDPALLAVEVELDYKDFILNDQGYDALADALKNIDPVYEMIAYIMVTTGLRIGGVLQFPVGANERNPNWLRYPELAETGRLAQKLIYLPKGKKRLRHCLVVTEALAKVHAEYIKSLRVERVKLFNERHGAETIAPMWINKNGKAVFDYDVWNAFKEASLRIGRRVVPHHLRHTYATYIVYNYFCAHGLKPNLAYAHDVHEQLKAQLGHSDIEVTKGYIRTIIRVEMEAWLPLLTPKMKQKVNRNMPRQVLSAVIDFFES